MTHQNGNVEWPFPFLSVRRTRTNGIYFLGTPANSALTCVMVSQNSSSTFSLDRPTTSILGSLSPFVSYRCNTRLWHIAIDVE
jgi:hypothetical protein